MSKASESLTVNTRFNRYIVECKYARWNQAVKQIFGFNRYIVECKCQDAQGQEQLYPDLIDT